MQKAKGAVSLFMSFVLALGLCPIPAWAEQPTEAAPSAAEEQAPGEGLEKSFAAQLEESAGGDADGDASEFAVHHDPDDEVTLIVRLADEQAAGNAGGFSTQSVKDTRSEVKGQITNLINGRQADEDAPWWSGISILSASPETALDVKYDYSTLLQGFAVTVPYRYVEDIQQLPGVASAFVEHTYAQMDEASADGAALVAGDAALGGSISPSAVATQSDEVRNIESLRMVGADSSEFTGKNTVAAVIDSGLDTGHEAFAALEGDYALSAEEVAKRVSAAGESFHGTGYKFVSTKIPFSYDYADGDDEATPSSSINEHGTHVAGIIGANSGGVIRGVAPDAQIVPMKVATDLLGTITDSTIIAALEDAVNLHVDTINMSLGSDVGFPSDNNEEYQAIYDSVKDHGVLLNVAAGNANSAAAYNNSGVDLPYATDPDDSIVAAPSTYAASMSVASVNAVATLPYVTVAGADSDHILCQPSSLGDADFVKLSGAYELYDAGYGLDASYATETSGTTTTEKAKGKIALIQRGSTDEEGNPFTFEKKVTYAADHGAVAAIVYNNVADESQLTTMSITSETRIPAVFVTNADGLKLAAAAKAHTKVNLSGSQLEATSGMTMSTFSSIGVNADMSLKPEITAPGGNIYSSVLESQYSTMSGTSMATPHMAGLTADVVQYLKQKDSGISATELRRLTNALLMSTATPIKDTEGDRNTYYTPRKQGAGLANVASATASPAYLSVEGSELPKGNLGSSEQGTWTTSLTVHNMSGTALVYDLETAALSADIEDGFLSRHSTDYAGHGIAVSYAGDAVSGNTVTVPANGTAEVTVTLTADDTFKGAVSAATAGTFVDGFVMLKAKTGSKIDLSLPYVGFYGNWSNPRVFDSFTQDGTDAHIRTSYAFHANTATELGINPLNTSTGRVEVGKFTVAPYSYLQRCAVMTTATSLLRSAGRLTYTISPKGSSEVVREYTYSNVGKSYMYTSNGIVTYAEAFLPTTPEFDGTDSSGAVLPAGWYTETIQACVMDGDDVPDDAVSFDFYLDTQAPQVKSARVVETQEWDNDALAWKSAKKIEVKVSDAGFIAGMQLVTTNGYAASSVNLSPRDAQDMDADHATSTATYVFDYDEVMAKLGSSASANKNKVIVNAYDYGLNLGTSDVILKDSYPTGITLSPASASLMVGQSTQLDSVLAGDDLTATRISWTSSDEGVTTVDSTGLVEAVGAGTATITATAEAAAGATAPSATASVTVTEVSDGAGIVLNRSKVSHVEGADFTLTATLAPSLAGQTVNWTVGDQSLVRQTAVSRTTATFRALKAGTTTVTASAAGKTATCTVTIEAANAADFIIDENGVLIDYIGSSVDVVIPNNVTAIGTRSNYDGTYTPGDDENPVEAVGVFQGLPIETVVIPEGVTLIGDYAFDDCERLRYVEFKGDKLETIGKHAFSSTYKLSAITLPDSVEEIGESAFYYTGLLSLEIPSKVTQLSKNVLNYNVNLRKLTVKGKLDSIGDGALESTPSLTQMTPLNEGITTIGDDAFSGCGLPSIVLPSTVTSVGDRAFMSTAATEIELNDGLATIGDAAFSYAGCQRIAIPDSVTSVGKELAAYSSGLESVSIGKQANKLVTPFVDAINLTDISVAADNPNMSVDGNGCLCSKDKTELIAYPLGKKDASITIPDVVVTIDDYAFYDDDSLTSLTFGSGLKTIGANAFRNASLTAIADTKGLETIGAAAFANCTELTSVSLDHVKHIYPYCFAYDSALASIGFGDALSELGEAALIETNVKAVSLPDSCTTVGDSAFANNASLETVHLGSGLDDLSTGAFTNCFGMKKITVESGNTRYFTDSQNAVLYERSATDPSELTLNVCAIKSGITTLEVAAGTTRIGDFAFSRCESLMSVTLPDGIKELGTSAFNGCSKLATINLPEGLEVIGAFALSGTAPTTLTVPSSIKKMDEYSFFYSSVKYLLFLGTSESGMSVPGMVDDVQSLYVGPGFASIDFLSFSDSSKLKTVVINADVKDIDEDAFDTSVDTAFYVNPDYPDARAAVEALGIGTVQDYYPLETRCSVTPFKLTAGDSATITASTSGGVGGSSYPQYRFTKEVGGSEVTLKDWSTSSACTIDSLPDDGLAVNVYVRDFTRLETKKSLNLAPGYAAGLYAADLNLLEGSEADSPTSPLDVLIEGAGTVEMDGTTATVGISLSDIGSSIVTGIAVSGDSTVDASNGRVSLTVPNFSGSFPVTVATKHGTAAAVLSVGMDDAAPSALKSVLVRAIESTGTLNGARYTAKTWNVLTAALDEALAVNANPKASQATVDAATAALDEALDGLARNDVDGNWSAGDPGTYGVRVAVRSELYSAPSNCENYQNLISKQAQLIRGADTGLKLRLTVLPTQLGASDYSRGGYVTAQDLYETPKLGNYRGTLVEENAEEGWATYDFTITSITARPILNLYYYPTIMQDQMLTLTIKSETITSTFEPDLADKTALIKLYNQASALDLGAYLDGDVKDDFESALDDARSALKFKSLSQDDVDAAYDALVVAQRSLVRAGQTGLLGEAIAAAKRHCTGNYTSASINALKGAISAGERTAALAPGYDEAASATETVLAAFIGLVAASDDSDAKAAARVDLDAAVTAAGALDASGASPELRSRLSDAQTAASTVKGDASSTPAAIVDATDALRAAIAAVNEASAGRQSTLSALSAAIEEAAAIQQGTKFASAYRTLRNAIGDAQAVASDPLKGQSDLEAALAALSAAVEAFDSSAVQASTTQLSYVIEKAQVLLDSGDAKTDAAKTALGDSILAAQAIVSAAAAEGSTTTQADANAQMASLVSAMATFAASVEETTLAQLASLIANVKTTDQGNKILSAWTALQNAIANAEAVHDDAALTQEGAEQAIEDLRAAATAFASAAEAGDKTELAAAIAQGSTLTQGSKTDAAWSRYGAALAQAKAVNANGDATQSQVDDATAALLAAIETFRNSEEKANAELQELIDTAERLDRANFTSGTWTTFSEVLAAAKSMLGGGGASDGDLANMRDSLKQAMEYLELGTSSYTIPVKFLKHGSEAESEAADYLRSTAQVSSDGEGGFYLTISVNPGYERYNIRFSDESTGSDDKLFAHANDYDYVIPIDSIFGKSSAWVHLNPIYEMHHQFDMVLDPTGIVAEEADELGLITGRVYSAESEIINAIDGGASMAGGFFESRIELVKSGSGSYYAMLTAKDAAKQYGLSLADEAGTTALDVISESPLVFKVPLADPVGGEKITFLYDTDPSASAVAAYAGQGSGLSAQEAHRQVAILRLADPQAITVASIDKTALASLISQASSTGIGTKTDAAFAALGAAIQAAQAVADRTDATTAEVNVAAATLQDALDAFAASPNREGNKAVLKSLIRAAQSSLDATKVSASGSDVDAGSMWTTAAQRSKLQTALNAAQKVLADTTAVQEQIDSAVDALAIAYSEFDAARAAGKKTASASASTSAPASSSGSSTGSSAAKVAVKKGASYKVSGSTYKVLNASKKTVALTAAKNAKSVTVPASVKLADGKAYKVVQASAGAFKGSKIRTVTIGKNVTKLAAKAFKGSKATTVIFKGTGLAKKAAVKGAFTGSKVKTAKVKVGSAAANKKAVKSYKKVLTKAICGKKLTVK